MANALMNGASFIFLLCASTMVSAELRYSIPEETDLGTFVGNIAEDLRLNVWELSVRKCRLVSDQMKQYLEVNEDNGDLFVSERIDREHLCRQSLACSLSCQIVLYDPEEMHSVTVEILDINDNSPIFPNDEFSLQISELSTPGARFPLKSARDPDVGTNTVNTYEIGPNKHFSIKVQSRRGGSKTAELQLENPLDREQQATFQLMLTAHDGGTPCRSGTVLIIIAVVDVNDNAPVFVRESYTANIAENVPKGTLVTTINAKDLDEGSNAELTYSFTDHVPQLIRELFRLDSQTGQIRVEGTLNFEKSSYYEFDAQAVDNGSSALTAHTKVIITLSDVNDNAPVIHVISFSSTVQENAQPGTMVATIRVTDSDSGENSKIHCQIPKEFPFTLQAASRNDYRLVTHEGLDRETTAKFNISISAWDNGSPPLSTQRSILILVSDINDNAPQFTQSSYNVYVTENNAPGSSIFSVSALDLDIDKNGEVIYTVQERMTDQRSASRFVTINAKNGNIYALFSFDYEYLKHFQLNVQAHDSGSPPMNSIATVNVIILDQNDNIPIIVSPLILNGSTSVEIVPQSVYPGYLVTKVSATDADSGQNARLSYQLLEIADPILFTVGVLSGEIRATRSLRDEELITNRIVVCVSDNGQPSLSSTAIIFFSILPNSTVPPYESSIELREWKGIPNLNLYLVIVLGSTSFLFLATIIILVMLKCKQDRNIDEVYRSRFCCSDPMNLENAFNASSNVTEDSNHVRSGHSEGYRYTVCLSPESSKSDFLFLKPCHSTLPFNELSVLQNSRPQTYCTKMAYTFCCGSSFAFLLYALDLVAGQIRYSIPEELDIGAFVGNVAEDLSLNVGELSARGCRLVSDEKIQLIKVNQENGNLFVSERIDREQLCGRSSTCSLSFQITLDHPVEIHRVQLEIIDENDHSPTFAKGEYALRIIEVIAPGARFPLVSAHDPDVGRNRITAYEISPNEHFTLKLHTRRDGSKVAELILVKQLDREQQSVFHLVLTAIDGGTPPRSGTAQVTVTVMDANDNAPVFDHEIYKTNIGENAPNGRLVIQIHAGDLDEGINAQLTYSFTSHTSPTARDLFKLDPITGEIKVHGVLDFEKSDIFELDVEAVDQGAYAMTGRTQIIVELIDMNDNSPEIEITSISSAVPEDALIGTLIAGISVRDADVEQNAQIWCEVNTDISFKLQMTSTDSYKLITNGPLDREFIALYNLSISARDRGSPPLETTKNILVSISDINDNAPRFTQSSYNVFVTENNIPGVSIFVITALDPDIDQNGDVSYTLLEYQAIETPVPSLVMINSKSGNIYALRSFDYEQLKNFRIIIQGQDAGSPTLSSNTTVNIIILDQNDNAPIIISPFAGNSSPLEITHHSLCSECVVAKVIATDADSGQNMRLSYHLLHASDPGLFNVGLLSGDIRTTRSFNDQDSTMQNVVVMVKDNGEPSLSSTATILFTILANATDSSAHSFLGNQSRNPSHLSNLNGYLIIIFGSTSIIFLATISLLLALKCKQDRNSGFKSFCGRRNASEVLRKRTTQSEFIGHCEGSRTLPISEAYHYTVCLSPESSKSDFLFLKPCNASLPLDEFSARETNVRI
ncbi:uncharacterized protein LOC144599764 [Rhinoraja longicauda]